MPRKHKVIGQDELNLYIDKYKNGTSIKELCSIYGRQDSTIINVLKRVGVYIDKNSRWTEEEINILKEFYPISSIDTLISKLPRHAKKQIIISKASKLGIKKNRENSWTAEEYEILKENYGKISSEKIYELLNGNHSTSAIRSKAQKSKLASDPFWTQDEDCLLKETYSNHSFSEILNLFPNKTAYAIMAHARKLNIKSQFRLSEEYSEEQISFIKKHWQDMNDFQIAECLGRKSPEGIRAKRVQFGLYKIKRDYSKYSNLDRFFRGHIQQWKTDSIKSCNYKCVLTESKDFAVHHLHGFNTILKEVYQELDDKQLLKSTNIEDYTKEELDIILNIFNTIHSKYPLGVCVRKDIHDLFHRIYGSGGNTETQWEKFCSDYKSGIYDLQIAQSTICVIANI